MKTPSFFARAVLAPVTAASLLILTGGCQPSPGPHPPPAATTRVDPKDAKDAVSPGPHPHAQRAKRHHPSQSEDEPLYGSPGPHPVNGEPPPATVQQH